MKKLSIATRLKISKALKGKPKPSRSLRHRINLSRAMSKSYVERYGEKKAKIIIEKIRNSNLGKKRLFRNEKWRKNLSNSLKGRKVWNKGKRGLQKAWNKKILPEDEIINLYINQDLSVYKIARKFDVSIAVILRILNEHNIKIRGSKYLLKGKKLDEIMGTFRANLKRKRISDSLKGRRYTWGDKISKSLKKYYRENNYPEEAKEKISAAHKKLWMDENYRNRLVKKHREYLKKHPEELERLKEIQYPKGITSVENKMLEFLKKNFIEGEDFHFDKQDITKKTFYRPDFQFPKSKIIIEIDGYYKHYSKEGYQRDKIREYYLKKAGWKIYRFNFYDVDRNYKFTEVKNRIMDILNAKC